MKNNNNYKLFVRLCESVMLVEDSTSMDIIKGLPGGSQVIKFLHTKYNLSHDQEYVEQDRIPWRELKDFAHGGWVLLQYARGFAAIRQKNNGYSVVYCSRPDLPGVGTFYSTRGNEVMTDLKNALTGNPVSIWVGHDTAAVEKLQSLRKSRDAEQDRPIDQMALLNKFKPMFSRALTLAIADIKGMVSTMIKNDEFHSSRNKLERLQKLQTALEHVTLKSDQVPDIISRALNTAVVMTASYFYPEETGDISRRYGGEADPESRMGIKHVFKDINAGDNRKLATVLAFFKRALITG